MSACIIGWSHTPFGKHDALDLETLIVKVAREAVADAGLEPKDIDAIYLGHLNAGFVRQEFPSSLTLQAFDEWRLSRRPAWRTRARRGPRRSTRG